MAGHIGWGDNQVCYDCGSDNDVALARRQITESIDGVAVMGEEHSWLCANCRDKINQGG